MSIVHPDFSVFGLVERSSQASILIRKPHEMARICAVIEKRIEAEQLDGLLYVGFQKISQFLKRRKQYERIAGHLEHIYVFAHFDVPPPTINNVRFIPIEPTDALIHEWFLVFHGTTYFSALVATKSAPSQSPDFRSIWTFELEIIQILSDWLASLLDAKHLPYQNYDYVEQGRLMDNDLDDYLNVTTG